MHDIIIKNGTLIDGSGAPSRRADVAIDDHTISFIGDLGRESAHKEIDATDCYVCPGLIDAANRSDVHWQLFRAPSQESLLYQGVSTVIGGNSGASLAPLSTHEDIKTIQKWIDLQGVHPDWHSMAQYFDVLTTRARPAVHCATLVGHETLRRAYVRDEQRSLTDNECTSMQQTLATAMEEGALGLSSSFHYAHVRTYSDEEVESLLRIVKKYNGIYATHLRDESEDLLRALDEALMAADATGVRLHITHLKACGERNWPLMQQAIEMIEYARTQGIDVTFDAYPYTTTSAALYTFLPQWVSDGGYTMMLKRLSHERTRVRVVAQLEKSTWDFSHAIIADSPLMKMLPQRNVGMIAHKRGLSPEEVIVDLLRASDGHAMIMMKDVLHAENVRRAVTHPFSIVTSNASGYCATWRESGEMVHPRSFGTFARVFRKYVRDEEVLSWEEAIYKMTGKVAQRFGLARKGILALGYDADVIVIDPRTVTDHATIDEPYQYAEGVVWSIIGGTIALAEGVYTGARSGKVVRREA